MALFPAWDELDQYAEVDDLLQYYNIPDVMWQAFEGQVGAAGRDVRLVAALPRLAIVSACGSAVLPDGAGLTPIQATQVGLVWRLARRIVAHRAGTAEGDFVDIDPWTEAQPDRGTVAPAPVQSNSGVKERVLKMASLIDQTDESELLPPTPAQVDGWVQNYVVIMGSHPEESIEPTGAQLAALSKKVHVNLQAPYTDFGIWTPFERKVSKTMKFRVFTPLGNGQFLQRDLPGPSSLQAWRACWAVFRTAALMLQICTLASLENYSRHIERLSTQWPQCWGLIASADDTARAERMERIKRRLVVESGRGRQVPHDFDALRPWSCVLNQLVEDTQFWAEKVHHPAAAWIAAGGRGAPTVATEAAILEVLPGGDEVAEGDDERHGRRRQANRDKKMARKKKILKDREELKVFRGKAQHQGEAKGKGKGKLKSKDQSGGPLCFSWDSNSGSCAGVAPGGECKAEVKRAHKCRICLSPAHRSTDCPNR
eukprot:Skav225390  [mRNA]  locus=scaffold2656:212303:213754:+ [translate_table: standard]